MSLRCIEHQSTPLEHCHGFRKRARTHVSRDQRPDSRSLRTPQYDRSESERRYDICGLANVFDGMVCVDDGSELWLGGSRDSWENLRSVIV